MLTHIVIEWVGIFIGCGAGMVLFALAVLILRCAFARD